MATKKPKQEKARSVTRKGEQLVAILRDAAEGTDFQRRLTAKCEEAGLKVPPMVPYGSGERVAIACKSRDQAIFVLDFAEETIADMNAEG
jgi:hypothetical protein